MLGASGGFGTLFSQVLIAVCLHARARTRVAADPRARAVRAGLLNSPELAGHSGGARPAGRRVHSGWRPGREAPPRAHPYLCAVVSSLFTHGRQAMREPSDSRARW